MKALAAPITGKLTRLHSFSLIAVGLSAIAIVYNGEALLHGVNLIWEKSGYASLILAPLALLLATAILKDCTEPNPDRKALEKQYGIVAALAPVAGYFGTVIAIMGAVQSLGSAENAESLISMVDQVFSRMGTAFTSTAEGLVLAMIAMLMLRIRKEDAPSQEQHLEKIASLLQVIASDMNDIRPVARRQVMEEHRNGGNRYETVNL